MRSCPCMLIICVEYESDSEELESMFWMHTRCPSATLLKSAPNAKRLNGKLSVISNNYEGHTYWSVELLMTFMTWS